MLSVLQTNAQTRRLHLELAPTHTASAPVCAHNDVPHARAHYRFTFDHVYDQDSPQSDVYSNSAQQVVLSILQGYNAAIIAYGQTGTGKTYTMEVCARGVRAGGGVYVCFAHGQTGTGKTHTMEVCSCVYTHTVLTHTHTHKQAHTHTHVHVRLHAQEELEGM